LWVLCVVRYRSLRRADNSSRGVLSSVACLEHDREAWIMRRPCPNRGCYAMGEEEYITHETAIRRNPPIHTFTTDITWPTLNRPTLKHVMFLRKSRKSNFCGYVSTEGVFVTELSGIAGISFWRIVWITTNCCFI